MPFNSLFYLPELQLLLARDISSHHNAPYLFGWSGQRGFNEGLPGTSQWLGSRRLPAAPLNNWGVNASQRSHLRLSGRKRRIVIWRARRQAVTTLPPGKLPPLRAPESLLPPSSSVSLLHSFWLNARGERVCSLHLFQLQFIGMTSRTPVNNGQPPLNHLKRPLGIIRFDSVISWLLRKAILFFSKWCYLSCSVLTPCNDDLSLFSVTCSIFIYNPSFFHCVTLALSPILLCHTCN